MTYEQYWCGDCTLPIYYRKAHEMRVDHENYSAWLQGMYVYDAIAAISPVLHAFAKKGTKAQPYLPEPYKMKNAERPVERQEVDAKIGAAKFLAFAAQFNKKFAKT
jgi:hypothetical protein